MATKKKERKEIRFRITKIVALKQAKKKVEKKINSK